MIAAIAEEARNRIESPRDDNPEWFNVAGQRLLAFAESADSEVATAAYRRVIEYFYTRGDFGFALRLSEKGLELASRFSWPASKRFFHHMAAVLLKSIGDTGGAVSNLAAALDLAKSLGDPVAECRTWGQLASTVLNTGQFTDVIQYARRGLAIASQCGDAAHDIRVQCNQLIAEASLHLMLDPTDRQRRLAEGLVTVKNALRESPTPRTAFDKLQVNRILLTETQLQVRAGHIADAREAAKRCRVLAEETGNVNALLFADIACAMVDGAAGDVASAKRSLNKLALGNAKRDDVKADIVAGLAFVYEKSGDSEGAANSRAELYQSWQRKHIASTFRVLDQIAQRYPLDEKQFLHAATLEAIETIAVVGEIHDDDTGTHVYRVGALAALIAKRLGWAEEEVRQIEFAARLHDIGKIAIHADIMLKPGMLTSLERLEMQKHAMIGSTILSRIVHPVMAIAAQIAGAHHERWDGKGYPFGLAGKNIPLAARITSVADVFDALTHSRCYKAAWTPEDALEEISRGRGSAFDPDVVDAFMHVLVKLLKDVGTTGIEELLSRGSRENAFISAREFLTSHSGRQFA
jgi:putative two-component system response regulator